MKNRTAFWQIMFILLFISLLPAASAQHLTGLIFDDEGYQKIKQLSQFSGGKMDDLPMKSSLKDYCPAIQNQGQTSSCTGWAVGYGAMSIMQAKQKDWTDINTITKNAFSAMSLYNTNQVENNCKAGTTLDAVLEYAKTKGACLHKDFDLPISRHQNSCSDVPSSKLPHFTIQSYYSLFEKDPKKTKKNYKVQKSIAKGVPVIVGMGLNKNFISLDKNNVYWEPDAGNSTHLNYGHAMVVIGYDDGKQAFEIMNSWGKEWGQDGYMWIKYDDFAEYCYYAMGISMKKQPKKVTDDKKEVTQQALYGNLTCRVPIFGEGKIRFEAAKVMLKDAYTYHTLRTDWPDKQRFQLAVRNIRKNSYIYVFSIDPENKLNIHWPRQAALNPKFEGLDEGPLVPYESVDIIIPGAERALIKALPGTDQIVILYAEQKLTNFKEIAATIQRTKGSYKNRLNAALGEQLIPTEQIKFDADNMNFEVPEQHSGHIVSIVLNINN